MPAPAQNPDTEVTALVTQVHAAAGQVCIVVTGAGALALAWLFGQAGASRTVLEALVPYSSAALYDFTGRRASQHVSAAEANLMAEKALGRAKTLAAASDEPPVLTGIQLAGVACTAAIATDRTRRGQDRCHVAFVSSDGRRGVTSLVMLKGARDRSGEEDVTSRIILNAIAEAKGVAARVRIPLVDGEKLEVRVPGEDE